MKNLLTFLFILFVGSLWSQEWDTIYSDNEDVDLSLEIWSYNCYFVNIDTTIRLVYYSDSKPKKTRVLHSTSKKLLVETWESNDTVYFLEYHSNGQNKTIGTTFQNDWIEHSEYYANGQLKEGGKMFRHEMYPINRFYPDGNLMIKGFSYGYMTSPFGHYEEYHPNGQVACIKNYALPDTTIDYYQEPKLIDEVYYDINGNQLDSSNYVIDIYTEYLQPKGQSIKKIDGVYTHHAFENQDGYTNGLNDLKIAITKRIKIPKSCNCSTGLAWISFRINKDGSFSAIDVDYSNSIVKNEIEAAIKNLGKWKPALLDNESVEVYIYTYLVLN